MKLRHPEKLVGSQPSSSKAARPSRGFTLLEVQIAILVLALAMIGMIGHGRVYGQILAKLQTEHRFDGVAVPSSDRVVVSVEELRHETSPPRCAVELQTMDDMPGSLSAEVRVTRRTL